MPDAYPMLPQEALEIVAAFRAEMRKGTPPGDPALRNLTRRGLDTLRSFVGGDPGALRQLARLARENPGIAARFGLEPAVIDYIMQALQQAGAL